MHLAYSYSLHSSCIQRQVGAVITDVNYCILSAGYNAPPRNSESCYELYSQCFRKRKEIASFELTHWNFCPLCGNKISYAEASKPLNCNKCKRNLLELLPQNKKLDLCRSLHAEENAILANPYFGNGGNTIIFTTTFPCMLCAKKIVNAGIRKVVFVEPYPVKEAYEILFDNAIEIKIFEGVKSLSFNWIFRHRGRYIKSSASQKLKDLNKLTGENNGKMS